MTHRILVLGAGYAGLSTTKRLAHQLRHADVTLTLVNATDQFTERVRLHQLATGQRLAKLPLSEALANTSAEVLRARVTAIDPRACAVQLDAAPHGLGYDTLVNALGSRADVETVPGVAEHAYTVAEDSGAQQLAVHLAGTSPGGRVIVVGGGLTGIETATEIAETYPRLRVELVTAEPLGGWLSLPAQRYLHQAFERREILIHERVQVDSVDRNALLLDTGRELPADTIVWAAGFRASPHAQRAGLTVDTSGRMQVDHTLRSVSHPNVYGVGDAAAAKLRDGNRTRMSCQTALPMGLYAADTIARQLTGRPARPIRIRYVWQNISLGRRDGLTQFTRADDTPINTILTGTVAAGFKETVTRGAALAARHPGPYHPHPRYWHPHKGRSKWPSNWIFSASRSRNARRWWQAAHRERRTHGPANSRGCPEEARTARRRVEPRS